jgi:hypothetical protein
MASIVKVLSELTAQPRQKCSPIQYHGMKEAYVLSSSTDSSKRRRENVTKALRENYRGSKTSYEMPLMLLIIVGRACTVIADFLPSVSFISAYYYGGHWVIVTIFGFVVLGSRGFCGGFEEVGGGCTRPLQTIRRATSSVRQTSTFGGNDQDAPRMSSPPHRPLSLRSRTSWTLPKMPETQVVF